MMQEQQSDDFYIPTFLLESLSQPGTDRPESQAEDFMMTVQGWTEYFPLE